MRIFFWKLCWILEVVIEHQFTYSSMYKVSIIWQGLCWGLKLSTWHRYLSSFKDVQWWILWFYMNILKTAVTLWWLLEKGLSRNFFPTISAILLTDSARLVSLCFACSYTCWKAGCLCRKIPLPYILLKNHFGRTFLHANQQKSVQLEPDDSLTQKNSSFKDVLVDPELPCAGSLSSAQKREQDDFLIRNIPCLPSTPKTQVRQQKIPCWISTPALFVFGTMQVLFLGPVFLEIKDKF